jgi:hypothetical protein
VFISVVVSSLTRILAVVADAIKANPNKYDDVTLGYVTSTVIESVLLIEPLIDGRGKTIYGPYYRLQHGAGLSVD